MVESSSEKSSKPIKQEVSIDFENTFIVLSLKIYNIILDG